MAYFSGPNIVTDGLVLALDAASERSYPGTGTTWNDLSGSGYTHTLVNSPAYGAVDGVVCFNMGTNGYTYPPGSTYTLGASYTYTGWARILADSQTTSWRTLWRPTPHDHVILVQDATNIIGYYDNDSGGGFVSYGLNVGTMGIEEVWTLYTVVASSGTSTLYINDNEYSASVSYTAAGNSHWKIGYEGQGFGEVASTMIYNRALTTTEISQNYNAQKNRFI
tara:strand:+ start:42 stop:707 length:666 start_codon:yes stop_codon:yes gene_type:complete